MPNLLYSWELMISPEGLDEIKQGLVDRLLRMGFEKKDHWTSGQLRIIPTLSRGETYYMLKIDLESDSDGYLKEPPLIDILDHVLKIPNAYVHSVKPEKRYQRGG